MESITNEKGIECKLEMKERRFPESSYNSASLLFKIKGTLAGKNVIISILPIEDKYYMNPKLAN